MQELNDLARTLSSTPLWALIAMVVLAGFALAGYAIYAVMTIAKGRR
jgi:hypothetical protein